MSKYILAILAFVGLSACSPYHDNSMSAAWGELTMSKTEGALTDYTDVVYQHSQESIANYSLKAVQLCKIKKGGMTEEDLVDLIHDNYNEAKKCWNALVTYPNHDKRFHIDGSIEKEVYANFLKEAKTYRAFFVNEK